MPTLLMGYDTEYHAIGENLARGGGDSFYHELPYDTTSQGVDIISRIHQDLGVTGTLFVCGRTLVHNVGRLQEARDTGVLDIQQHTYSHSLFKQDEWEGGVFFASPPEALRHELAATSSLIKEHLGLDCIGLRTPHGYYQGLSDVPDMLQVLRDTGIEFVSSWARNSDHGNPSPLDTQPFWYDEQGFPEILELPAQHWLDAFWFETYGREKGAEFLGVLREAIDEIVEKDLVYGACFHEWAMLLYDESGTSWCRGLIEYALESGVEVMSYADFYEREAAKRMAPV